MFELFLPSHSAKCFDGLPCYLVVMANFYPISNEFLVSKFHFSFCFENFPEYLLKVICNCLLI